MNVESAARPEPVRAPRFGLSGKLLLLTILFVMIAEVLIYAAGRELSGELAE